jgi:Flp pilus assembly protein TadD
MINMRGSWSVILLLSLASAQESPPRSDQPNPTTQRAPGESSSKETVIDLTPPKSDADHPGSESDEEAVAAATGVAEAKPWNPHRAAKNIEVGDFYFRDKNYKAAISRYREALAYKPKDAEATYKLALALEKAGQPVEAAQFYSDYFKIISNGPRAIEAKKGLERVLAPRGNSTSNVPAETPLQAAERLLNAKEFDAATSAFRTLLRAEDPDPVVRYRLAQSLEGKGNLNLALSAYFDYLRLQPGGRYSSEAAAAIERLKRQGATISQSSQTPP